MSKIIQKISPEKLSNKLLLPKLIFIMALILALLPSVSAFEFDNVKSYNSITEHTGVGFFRTTATIYLIGAVSAIILIGFLIIIVAKIIEIVAFFMIPDKLPASKSS